MIVRMHSIPPIFLRLTFALLILLLGWGSDTVVLADDEVGPDRTIKKTIEVLEHTWWAVQWSDNEVLCELNVDHEGLPTGSEIYSQCGEDVFEEWAESMPCEQASIGGDTSKCAGLYLYYIHSQLVEREIQEELPTPVVWVSLSDCREFLYGYRCYGTPVIHFVAEEPLPFEHITAIHVELGGEVISCQGEICDVPLNEEHPEGATMEFRADSSFGDESETFTALIRTIQIEQIEQPSERSWQVDVLSTQWEGAPPQACSLTWGAFLPVEGLPGRTPDPLGICGSNRMSL
jgi:hypothetical protein